MDNRKKISVALAAYKGEKYISEQLSSIIPQLSACDEIIVSDDLSGGELCNIVMKLSSEDNRIKYVEGPGKGVIANFENAIKNCTGDYIFLCDQDDVWLPEKVSTTVKALDDGADLVLHNALVTDGELKVIDSSFFDSHSSSLGFFKNLIRNSYMGCCMAFRKSLVEKILPFPDNIPMHDQWIGLLAEKTGKTVKIDKPLILYRRHGNNVTGGKTSLSEKIEWRKTISLEIKKRLAELK